MVPASLGPTSDDDEDEDEEDCSELGHYLDEEGDCIECGDSEAAAYPYKPLEGRRPSIRRADLTLTPDGPVTSGDPATALDPP